MKLMVRGWWHPPAVADKNYPGWALREDEVPSAAKKYKGKPVYVEHDWSRRVGVVDKLWMDTKTKALAVDLCLDDTEDGRDTMRRVKEGKLNGLSIGFNAMSNDKAQRVSPIDPKEISIVEKGDMPGTHIFAFSIHDNVYVSPQHSVYIANSAHPSTKARMTSEADQTQADILSGLPRERIELAVRMLEEKERLDREKEIEDKRRATELITGPIHEKYMQLLSKNAIDYDENIGEGLE